MKDITEKEIDVPTQLQEIGKKIGEYKDVVVKQFKDMDVEFETWNFEVGKTETKYTLDVCLKIAIKPKKES